jgi:hypothetical protein
MESQADVNSLLIGFLGITYTALLSAVIAMLVRLGSRFRKVEEEIITIKTQVSPLWARVQAQISNDLHHPHPRYKEMDRLLEKLESLEIVPAERARLRQLLLERSKDMHPDITDEQRRSALIMIPVMEMVIKEKQTEAMTEEKEPGAGDTIGK